VPQVELRSDVIGRKHVTIRGSYGFEALASKISLGHLDFLFRFLSRKNENLRIVKAES
jgi:hypothetical protein